MSNANESNVNALSDNDELDELLQSALNNFDKPSTPKEEKKSSENLANEEVKTAGKTLQEEFESKFANLLLNDTDDVSFSSQMRNLLTEVKNEIQSISTNPNGEESGDDTNTVDEAINSLSQNIEQIRDSMKNEQLPENFNMGFPMMDQMFQVLMSKEVLYPSLQSVKEKYPTWLEENRDSIDANELNRYSRQYNIIKQICELFESERDSDDEEVKHKRFTELFTLLQEMTDLGQPPSDFAESIPAGIPNNMLDVGSDPSSCNTM